MNVEHCPSTHEVGMREIVPCIGQRAPFRSSGNAIPVHQRDQCIPVLLRKFDDGRLADDPHVPSLQNANPRVKARTLRTVTENLDLSVNDSSGCRGPREEGVAYAPLSTERSNALASTPTPIEGGAAESASNDKRAIYFIIEVEYGGMRGLVKALRVLDVEQSAVIGQTLRGVRRAY
jgi:hypothetical protein